MNRPARIRATTITRPRPMTDAKPARRRDVACVVGIFVAGLAVYLNTLGHGFVWDDLIALDQRIRFYRSPLDAFLEPADIPGFPGVAAAIAPDTDVGRQVADAARELAAWLAAKSHAAVAAP